MVLTAAVVTSGCGADENDPKEPAQVGRDFVSSLQDEAWPRACELQASPGARCVADLRRSFAGQDVSLLPAGAYQSGSDVTDNRSRFAFTSRGSGERSSSYFEVRSVGGRNIVDLEVTVIG